MILKACPFCGNKNPHISSDGGCQSWRIACCNCGAIVYAPMGQNDTKEKAIEQWNKRICEEDIHKKDMEIRKVVEIRRLVDWLCYIEDTDSTVVPAGFHAAMAQRALNGETLNGYLATKYSDQETQFPTCSQLAAKNKSLTDTIQDALNELKDYDASNPDKFYNTQVVCSASQWLENAIKKER